jgi:AsmA protein
MKKSLKIVAMVFGAVVLIVALGIAYIVATFDSNRIKSELAQVVQEKQQRTLRIDGELSLSVFPKLGLKLGSTTLSEHGSEQVFAALDSARISVAVLPLLSKRVVVDTIELSGLKATLQRRADGSLNIDDFLSTDKTPPSAPAAAAPAVAFDVNGIRVADAQLTWLDRKSGQSATVSGLTLTTGRLGNASAGPLELTAHVTANAPQSDADVRLACNYDIDLDQRRFAVSKLDTSVKGALAGIRGLDFQLQAASIEALPAKQTVNAAGIALATHGSRGQTSFDLKLRLPKVTMLPQPAGGSMVSADIDADLTLADPQMPMKSVSLPIKGNARADLARQSADVSLSTRFDESNIAAKLAIEKFSPLALGFNVDVDRLDVDKYLPPKNKSESSGDGRIDLSALKGLNVHGSVNIGALQVAKVKATKIHLDLRGEGGRLSISPLSANLYEGATQGSVSVDAAGNAIAVRQSLSNVSINPLLSDLAGIDLVEGRGNVNVDVSTRGDTVAAMKQALAGSAAVRLGDGALKGINLAQRLREIKGSLSGDQGAVAAKATDRTDFTELSASFKINHGVARNDDLAMKSPFLRLAGSGEIDVGGGSLNYLAKASLVGTAGGQGGKERDQVAGVTVPVRISGPFDKPAFKLDVAAMATSAVQNKVDEKKQEVRQKVEDSVRDKLKGLLSR